MITDEQDILVLSHPTINRVQSNKDQKQIQISERVAKEALAIEQESAQESGNLGYLARFLIQATMPHSKLDVNEFSRKNGFLTLSIQSPSSVGLPYGHYPRILLAWITSEAVRTHCPTITLGNSLTNFLRNLGMSTTGGHDGTINRLKSHLKRLFCSTISWTYDNKDDHQWSTFGVRPIESATLWWDPKNPHQDDLWKSKIGLNQRFYEEIIRKPVPVDLRILRALAHEKSSMAIDIYTWLTYRLFYLKGDTTVPWEGLALQFGGDYARLADFKKNFLLRLGLVKRFYPEAKVMPTTSGLVISRSWPSVPTITAP